MSSEQKNTSCTRCGLCCRKGGPALHQEDLPLLRQAGGPDLTDLVTLRAGEPALDQISGRLEPLAQEIVKIRGRDGSWTCVFYAGEETGCSIYAARPLECRVLSCRDTAEIERVYARDRLTRRAILPPGHALLDLLAEHEQRCAVGRFAALLAREDAAARAGQQAMLVWDREARLLLTGKSGMDPLILDFLFGRPLERLIPALTAARRHA